MALKVVFRKILQHENTNYLNILKVQKPKIQANLKALLPLCVHTNSCV